MQGVSYQGLGYASLGAAQRGLGAAARSGSYVSGLRRHVQRSIQLAQQLLQVLVAVHVIQACRNTMDEDVNRPSAN